nr:uncharacterized protein LOC127333454 [Lolium perenne]
MPLWPDGDETSSGERLNDYSSDVPLNVLEQLYDPDFCGIETDCPETCDHKEKLTRYVAFEGENTGRRFLGWAAICGTVHWLDLEWPPSLRRCLVRLWELYDTECSQRIKESCESSSAYYKLNLEKKQILEKNKELQIELGKALSASQGSSS